MLLIFSWKKTQILPEFQAVNVNADAPFFLYGGKLQFSSLSKQEADAPFSLRGTDTANNWFYTGNDTADAPYGLS